MNRKKLTITKNDLKYMVNEAIKKTAESSSAFDFITPSNDDFTDDDFEDEKDERMEAFYDAIENLATDGIMCFRKIKEMISEDEYGIANAERLKPTLDKINNICKVLEEFIMDYGRV